jgi:hypothetical protein
LSSGRLWGGIILLFFVNYASLRPIVPNLKALGYTVNVLELSAVYMSSKTAMILYYSFLIFQLSAFPDRDGTQMKIVRLGKRWWLTEQILHGVFVSVLQYIVLTISIIVPLLPCIAWNNQWSEFMGVACQDSIAVIQINLMLPLDFQSSLTLIGRPFLVWTIVFALNLGCSMFFSAFIVVANLERKRGFGILTAIGIIFLRTALDYINVSSFGTVAGKIFDTIRYGLYPMSQNNLVTVKQMKGCTASLPLSGRIVFALCYFLLLTIGNWYWGIRKVKKADLI